MVDCRECKYAKSVKIHKNGIATIKCKCKKSDIKRFNTFYIPIVDILDIGCSEFVFNKKIKKK
jgi:hypothetical protein